MATLVRHEISASALQFADLDSDNRSDAREIARLYDALDHVSKELNPRTARLLAASRRKIAQKLMEEAGEVAIEAVRHRHGAVIRESADLVYQLVVLWRACGVAPEEVWGEMRYRANRFGIAEKLPKAMAHAAPAVGCRE